MNSEIQDVHDRLLAQHNALAEMLGNETDAGNAKTILMEMQEILHRIDLAQNLLFRETSQALEKAVLRVKESDGELKDAIKRAESVAKIVKATGEFLKFVDKAIDVAKSLAVI